MVKATLRSAVLLGLLAWSIPSFAEVQNVKVGGEVTVRGFHRENLDLRGNDEGTSAATGAETADTSGAGGTALDSNDDFFMSTVAVNVGADLTENVSTFIRVTSERDWNVDTTATGDVDISQAYVTLKELFYSPLMVRVGQQPIVWGRGLILGSNLLPGIILGGNDRNASITANEFTDFTAFDAIRATLDLSGVAGVGVPLTLDYVYIKQDENSPVRPDDISIHGINLGARFDAMSSEVETYFLNMRDKNIAGCTGQGGTLSGSVSECKNGSVNTIGLRGSAQPAEGASVWSELAYQFGKRVIDLEGIVASGDAQQAWLANLGADYGFANVAMSPRIGGEWRFTSGKDVDTAIGGWRPIAPGYFTTALREFQTRSTIAGFYPNDQTGVTSGATNQHELALFGSLKPKEDLTVNQRLSWFILDEGAIRASGTNSKRSKSIGTEWDTVATYNYTDDVQFGLIYGVFFPGAVYRDGLDDTAQELVSSVSVKF